MTNPTAPHDGDLEGRLRTVLADRAATITGPPPALPEATLQAADGPPATALHAGPRQGWGLAAAAVAAVLVLVGGLAVVLRDDGDTDQHVLTTEPTTDPFAGLPDGFDPATAARVFRDDSEAPPVDVARTYLSLRLGGGKQTADEILAGIDLEAGTADGSIVPVTWTYRDGRAGGGAVLVKVGEHGSDVVAATTPGVDLSDAAMTGSVVSGHVETTATDLPGPALVDVLPPGRAFATWSGGPPAGDVPTGYGGTAQGSDPFRIDSLKNDAIVTVRYTDDDGAVQAISEIAFRPPPEDDPPDLPDFDSMTEEEIRDFFGDQPVDPRCTAAGNDLGPLMTHIFPGGDGSASREAADPEVFAPTGGATPAEALAAQGARYGVELSDVTVAAPSTSTAVAGARAGSAPVQAFLWQQDGEWHASELSTVTSCWTSGKGNLTPPGDPAPLTRLSLSTIVSVRSGQLWYRLTDGTTWTVPLDADDFARGNIAVIGEYTEIGRVAFVGRDETGAVVLVDEAPITAPS